MKAIHWLPALPFQIHAWSILVDLQPIVSDIKMEQEVVNVQIIIKETLKCLVNLSPTLATVDHIICQFLMKTSPNVGVLPKKISNLGISRF